MNSKAHALLCEEPSLIGFIGSVDTDGMPRTVPLGRQIRPHYDCEQFGVGEQPDQRQPIEFLCRRKRSPLPGRGHAGPGTGR